MNRGGRFSILMLGVVFVAVGCTNNFVKSAKNLAGSSNSINASLPTTSVNGSGGVLTLSRVVKNNQDPSATFDLIGDGTGALGNFCVTDGSSSSSSSTTPNSGPSTCRCSYTYITSSGAQESFEADTTYHESNLIRCKYTGIPPSVAYVTIKIHLTNSDAYSNEVRYQMSGAGISTSLSDPASFARLQRYQCRDIVFVPHMFDPVVYDPFQSEDFKLTYPLNYYTTNMGGAFSRFSSASNLYDFNCPSIPNDSSAGLDLTVYSVSADSGGSKLIYPPTGSQFDRSTFYLARGMAGVFTVPLNAYYMPNNYTTDSGPIGYGASPIATGANQESCPDTSQVTIPPGYHWVKVWLFRADLPARRYVRSTLIPNALPSVSCNPGGWLGDKYCSPNDNDIYSTASLADRLLNNNDKNACVRVTAGGSGYFSSGTDLWARNQTANCGQFLDPINLCTTPTWIPYDPNPIVTDYDTGTTRYDFIYVVSPPTVMAADMANSATSVHNIYTPYRFMAPGDCTSADPDVPNFAGDCSVTRKISYGLKLHDVGSNGDPPASDPKRAGVFPLCALQPD